MTSFSLQYFSFIFQSFFQTMKMGVTTSLFVCCLTGLSVAVKVHRYRSDCVTANGVSTAEGGRDARVRENLSFFALAVTKEYFSPGLETELKNTGAGRTVCPICCENFGEDGNLELAVLECVHAYHFLCLESYALNRSNSKDTPLLCPVCQKVAISR